MRVGVHLAFSFYERQQTGFIGIYRKILPLTLLLGAELVVHALTLVTESSRYHICLCHQHTLGHDIPLNSVS